MEAWQYVLAAGFVLLPIVLTLAMWGQERLTARGLPVRRSWPRPIPRRGFDQDAAHGSHPGQLPDTAPASSAQHRTPPPDRPNGAQES